LSTVKVTNIQNASASVPNLVTDTLGNVSTPGTIVMSSSYIRNRLINGAMQVDQRNAGASVAAAGDAYTVDRWVCNTTQSGKGTWGQNLNSVTTTAGFPNYLGVQSSSAYSLLASDYFFFSQRIEGYNFADLGFGTASAQTVTISFRVYSSLTGTFGGSLRNYAGNRSYAFTYLINTANTWTSISVTIPGDTSGTWVGSTNAGAVTLFFGFGLGSTYSGTAGAWNSAGYVSATGAVSVVGTLNATFYITGVQLEPGSIATPFERRPINEVLAQCQRYYEKSYSDSAKPGSAPGAGNCTFNMAESGGAAALNFPFNVRKRTAPTMTFYDGAGSSGAVSYYNGSSWNNGGAITVGIGYQSSLFIQTNIATAVQINFEYAASAEL
jgi:hypothetical protein